VSNRPSCPSNPDGQRSGTKPYPIVARLAAEVYPKAIYSPGAIAGGGGRTGCQLGHIVLIKRGTAAAGRVAAPLKVPKLANWLPLWRHRGWGIKCHNYGHKCPTSVMCPSAARQSACIPCEIGVSTSRGPHAHNLSLPCWGCGVASYPYRAKTFQTLLPNRVVVCEVLF
jgi:hypothetical protein